MDRSSAGTELDAMTCALASCGESDGASTLAETSTRATIADAPMNPISHLLDYEYVSLRDLTKPETTQQSLATTISGFAGQIGRLLAP